MKYILILLLLSSTTTFSQKQKTIDNVIEMNFIQVQKGEKYSDVKGHVRYNKDVVTITYPPNNAEAYIVTLKSTLYQQWFNDPLYANIHSMQQVGFKIDIPRKGWISFHYENDELRLIHITFDDFSVKDIYYYKYKQ